MAEFNDHPQIRNLKQCYYELLNLEPEAREEEVRSAYKYQALRWHPDKNRSDPETAASVFKQVQQAYSVLSDPRQRSWYDKFRDKILAGNQELVDDEAVDVSAFLSSSCYSGFGDEEGGFYAVYRDLFDQVRREELMYEEEGDPTPPGFGSSDSPYDDVHAFYAHWTAFSTKKSFDHLMKFDVLEAPNRRTLRAMEKENVRMREVARRERNHAIRQLVAFVRKRDKRVLQQKQKMHAINHSNRLKTQEARRQQLQSRRQEEEEQQQESGWTSMATLERSLAALERRYDREQAAAANGTPDRSGRKTGHEDGEEEILILSDDDDEEEGQEGDQKGDRQDDRQEDEEAGNNMFCVACDKRFKSRPAFENHCRSKKHASNVQALKQALLQDDSLLT